MSAFFLNPVGLLALIGVPIVVALHLYRRRFAPRVVSAVFLWARADRTPSAGRKREPLRVTPSLVLEVLAALLLALVIAGARVPGMRSATHLVVVLDGSASMAAQVASERACDRATACVRDRIRSLPRGSLVTLIESGSVAKVLSGPAALAGEALDRLADYRPSAPRHDLAAAVSLALKLADQGQVVLVTDHDDADALPSGVDLVAVGRPLDNVAITHASRTRTQGSGDGQAFLTITSFARAKLTTHITFGTSNTVLAQRTLELEPATPHQLSFDLPADAPTVFATLDDDALVIDNRAVLTRPPARILAVATTLPADTCRTLNLASDRGTDRLERLVAMVPDVRSVTDVALAHLVIGAEAVAGDRATWCLTIEAAADTPRSHLVGPLLADRGHPLTDGLTLQGIVWSAETARKLTGFPVIAAGDTPLLTDSQSVPRVLRMNLDAQHSTLQRSPDWPILLANLIEMRRAELPGPERSNILVGEPFRYHDREAASYELDGEGQHLALRARGTLVVDGLDRPGRYVLRKDGTELCEIGVTFADAIESNLLHAGAGERPSTAKLATAQVDHSWLDALLLLAILAAVSSDWLWLARGAARSAA